MTHLAEALKKHYTKREGKIIFTNKKTLNQFALQMWEKLGFSQIDASVLSKVINGKRLFTPQQLRIFCQILAIDNHEEDYLLHCLAQDYNVRKNLHIKGFFLASPFAYELMSDFIDGSFRALYDGDLKQLENKCNLVRTIMNSFPNNKNIHQDIEHLYGVNLYLSGRVIECLSLPETVLAETLQISNKLLALAEKNKDRMLYAYAHALLANAYYLAGGYSYSANKVTCYSKAISFGMQILDTFQDTDNAKLFTMRVIAASAIYINDQETLLYMVNKTKRLLSLQPFNNFAIGVQLCATLTKGLAIAGISNPFSMKESAITYFKRDLTGKGIYEASSIKEEVDTLLALKTNDKDFIREKIKKGLSVAHKNQLLRHKNYFNTVAHMF